MSRRKLTIVVTCTDRKSASPTSELMSRNLPRTDLAARADIWRLNLKQAGPGRPLMDLYSGESWSQVRRLALKATSLGYEPTMYVASAGLGLRRTSSSAPAYAATFSAGHPDSVGESVEEARAWWHELPQDHVAPQERAIWILSDVYSRVVSQQLREATAPAHLLVFGGSREVCDSVRIPPDRALRRALGGTLTSLNVRSAIQWLDLSDGEDPFASAARERWRTWSSANRHHEVFDRKAIDDSAVIEFVGTLRARRPGISKTSALKELRDAGLACEQRRFSTLFLQAATR